MKLHRILSFTVIAILLLGLASPAASPFPVATAKAQPQLNQLAAQDADQRVSVIVQKLGKSDAPENIVTALGGQVTQDLHIINAFVAEMTAEAALELARSESVRWVSLDAKMQSSDAVVFTTWATSTGNAVSNGFTNSGSMVDSSQGPNGTYAHGANKKVSIGGFTSEITPSNLITKVELVLYGYTPTALSSGQTPKVTAWVGEQRGVSLQLDYSAFNSNIGSGKAGPLYFDITGSRLWLWEDFENNLQIVIDQSLLKSTSKLYYDAVGLRVSSEFPDALYNGINSFITGTELDDGTSQTLAAQCLNCTDSGGNQSNLTSLTNKKQANYYNQIIRSSDLWNTSGKLQGKGVTIAVVDSGIFRTRDLEKRVRVNVNFNSAYHDAADRYGHGTFVGGVIAGSGVQSGFKYMGVAPRADEVNVRVSDDQGMSYESDVINGLQWVYLNKDRYNIRVVNLSLNSSMAQSYNTSPLDAAVEVLWFNGIVVVVSAGNNGSATLYPPANDPFVITVGATDDKGTLTTADDVIASFSASGTTEDGFVKPDLVAPGRNITGLLPDNDKLTIGRDHPSNRVDKTYFRMSGTSVSAPMISGAVALLLQDEPALTPDQVKYRLMATANKNWAGYNVNTAGAGYLDIYASVYGTTTQSANTNIPASQLLYTGDNPIAWDSVGWNSVGWNSVGWNSVGWNSVGWNSVGWNSDYWGP